MGAALRPDLHRAFEYSDCRVEDARLAIRCARDAARRGADIRPRTRCAAARRADGRWRLRLEDRARGTRAEVEARALVNATGPWAARFLEEAIGTRPPARLRLVQGSHLVTRRLFDHDKAYVFQNEDRRICFAIPFEGDFTLIGTTDRDVEGDPAAARIDEAEIDYLLGAVNRWLRRPAERADIVRTYAGVRPLHDDGATAAQEATREYVLHLDRRREDAPLLSVFGGKLKTCRRLAEVALAELAPLFPGMGPPRTGHAHLPGGDFPWDGFDRLVDALRALPVPFARARPPPRPLPRHPGERVARRRAPAPGSGRAVRRRTLRT